MGGCISATAGLCLIWLKRFNDNHFDLAIVDPPYGINWTKTINYSEKQKIHQNKKGYKTHSVKEWDSAIPTAEYWSELFRVSKNQIVWGGNYFSMPPTRCFLIWDKKQPEKVSFASCEYAWTSFDASAKTFYKSPINAESYRIHPTQKPVALYKWLLTHYAKEGDKIFDSHGGSMSSAIACNDLHFDLDICELDKDYFDAGVKRFNNHIAQTTLF